MALREIRVIGDPVLNKTAKPVEEVNDRIKILIQDMLDTMYESGGVGLAAPQIGILRQVIVIDVSENSDSPIILINPEVIETSGEQSGYEGCLSVPGKSGMVTRPDYAKVKGYDCNMEEITVEGEKLLARALLHEIDHLSGHLYIDKVEGDLIDNEELEKEDEKKDKKRRRR